MFHSYEMELYSVYAQTEAMEAHPGTLLCRWVTMDPYRFILKSCMLTLEPGVLYAHPEAIEAHPGAMYA